MATLAQQIQSIIANESSISAMTRELKALGISMREINILLSSVHVQRATRREIDKITFGVEIECYNVEREEIAQRLCEAGIACYVEGYNHRDYHDHFKVVTDSSLDGNNTAEVVSPILKGRKGLKTLETVCKVLNEIGAKVNKSCGLHVHFGLNDIDFNTYRNIFINYAKIESLIDSIMPASRRNNRFCRSLHNYVDVVDRLSRANNKDEISYIFDDRYYKVNPYAYRRHNTIEFRQHSGTIDYKKIQNWIEFLKCLIEFSKENRITECHTLQDIPFLKGTNKRYYLNRQAALAS